MKRFLVVQHASSEFLGPFEQAFEERGIGFEYVRPFRGDALPGSAGQHDALWLLGGTGHLVGANRSPWIDAELRLIGAFRRLRRPVVGMGFGALVVIHACGGNAHPSQAERARWTQAHSTVEGAGDPIVAAIDSACVLLMHAGHVDLPVGVPALAVADDGTWLVARPDPVTCALLFRPELKPAMIEDAVMEEGRDSPDDIGTILEEARSRWADTQRVVERLIVALVQSLDLMTERPKRPVIPIRVV